MVAMPNSLAGRAATDPPVELKPLSDDKLVVVKRLRAGAAEDASLVQMFLDEARLAARLNHPNIVHTYEVEESADGYLLVMEYLEGQSLRRLAKALRAKDHR